VPVAINAVESVIFEVWPISGGHEGLFGANELASEYRRYWRDEGPCDYQVAFAGAGGLGSVPTPLAGLETSGCRTAPEAAAI
jgi:hypothetical protein